MARFAVSTTGRNGGKLDRYHHNDAEAHVRGWDVGVVAVAEIDRASGKDVVRVYRTGGSHAPSKGELLVTLWADSPNPVFGDDLERFTAQGDA